MLSRVLKNSTLLKRVNFLFLKRQLFLSMFDLIRVIRKSLFFLADVVAIGIAFYLAFFLRFEGGIPKDQFYNIFRVIVLASIIYLWSFNHFKLYSFSWSYVSTTELLSLAKATLASFVLLLVIVSTVRDYYVFFVFPRSTIFISFILIFIFVGVIRFAKRIYLQFFQKTTFEGKDKTLIVGMGDAGEQILRMILHSKDSPYLPVGLIDENHHKRESIIHGVRVLGKIDDIPQVARNNKVEQLIIALPSSNPTIIKRAVKMGREAGIQKIKYLPLIEMVDGLSLGDLREVQIQDLLGREPVILDIDLIKNFIGGKKVLITGAAGSIGSELCYQVAKFNPEFLLALDQDETGIFNLAENLKDKYSHLKTQTIVADIRDDKKMDRIFNEFRPKVVFHAAAYKHVPIMEDNPDEAIKNNIFGTKNIVDSALKYQVGKFVFISTDKAINPTSVMGATKRIGEMICQRHNEQGKTRFVAVRFGNVLDSRGSVIPIFREQIKKREAVTITHPDMKRYFMVNSEACSLVMQAGAMGQGGEVFVLDMGKPIKILDLAKEMIKLSGLEPDKDIPIVFTGVRPGEKFFEEILNTEEGNIATHHQKIFVTKLLPIDKSNLENGLQKLKEVDKERVKEILCDILPNYKTDHKNQ